MMNSTEIARPPLETGPAETTSAGPPPATSASSPEENPPESPAPVEGEKASDPSANPAPSEQGFELVSADTKNGKPQAVVVFATGVFKQKTEEFSKVPAIREAQSRLSALIAEFKESPAPSYLRRHSLLLLCVVLPTLLSTIYYGLIASDIFVSEAKFVVRSPNKKSAASGLGAMLEGAGFSGFSRAQDDIHTVREYVSSRDALVYLNDKLKLSEAWSSRKIDLFIRFNPLGWDGSNEALFEYYGKRVNVAVDSATGITTLTARVFSADQAFEINQILLGQAEHIVNVLNDRGRNDLIRFAENEVQTAEEKAKSAASALSNFRNTQAVVDPERQTQLHYEHISRLQEELVKTRSQLVQLKVFAPKSPHPPALELRQKTLENEIQKEMQQITGGENSLASKAAEYERRALDREFAEKQLASALASLEVARNEAQRQQLYLETISKPNLPDEATLPKRFRGILTTLVLGLVAWGILSMLLAGVREHQY